MQRIRPNDFRLTLWLLLSDKTIITQDYTIFAPMNCIQNVSIISILLIALVATSCYNTELKTRTVIYGEKQKGTHVFGRVDSFNIQAFVEANIEWVSYVPYASQSDFDSPNIRHNRGDSTALVQRNERWTARIETAHEAGLKVFLKPHIWLHNPPSGKWRSDIFPPDEKAWESWKSDYRDFIIRYAEIAERTNTEMFCIGAELSRLTKEKPEFWLSLIEEVRTIYSGKITYAANWHDEFEDISFWDKLDYIGIQAYFPLTKQLNPSVEELEKGWEKYTASLKGMSDKWSRPILFTEMGYKSTVDSGVTPWEWIDYSEEEKENLSLETQVNCYAAFFNTVWKKSWFAGVHIWQMRSDYNPGEDSRRGKQNVDFTPQGKPAYDLIRKEFSK